MKIRANSNKKKLDNSYLPTLILLAVCSQSRQQRRGHKTIGCLPSPPVIVFLSSHLLPLSVAVRSTQREVVIDSLPLLVVGTLSYVEFRPSNSAACGVSLLSLMKVIDGRAGAQRADWRRAKVRRSLLLRLVLFTAAAKSRVRAQFAYLASLPFGDARDAAGN